MSAVAREFIDRRPPLDDLRSEVIAGLKGRPRMLSPKLFYDRRGSELFDAICKLPEYYPTRTEVGILQTHAQEIADLAGPDALLVEPGSGNSHKVRLLLDVLRPRAYMPVEICREHLFEAAQQLGQAYPQLALYAICDDFTRMRTLPEAEGQGETLVFFPGSTIGNFEPEAARAFLHHIANLAGPGAGLLIGVDLKKSASVLNRAYNDAAGITAAFNRNLLVRLNRELQTDFQPRHFSHRAFYNESQGRIEMHLVSDRQQTVAVDGERFEFLEGEAIHTENSYKYAIEEFQALAGAAGWRPERCWTDEARLFSVHYLRAA